MAQQFTVTNVGMKGVNLLTSNDPDVWSGLGAMSGKERDVYYARVAAAFRAFNLKANTVGNMPFCLYKNAPANDPERKTNIKAVDEQAEGDEVDNSANWQNVVGFLPNPSELLRLATLSYMATNTIYNIRTGDVIGRRVKGLRHARSDDFYPWANVTGTQLDYIERHVGSTIERYAPDGKPLTAGVKSSLVYMWRLDHTTELLPSPNTEALAIMEAAGVVYYKNFWIHNFYRRGGIKPTLISVKGLIDKDSKEQKERSWSDWLKGVGSRWSNNIARLINGENMSATTIGDGVGDMKDNTIHQDALADIAMGVGMPLSLLVANSANYATAKEEKATWYENDIIPLCNWLAYEYNRQVFFPLGLRLEFHPETLDPQQEDETQRATAYKLYVDSGMKPSVAAQMLGMELPSGVEYEDLDGEREEAEEVDENGKPITQPMNGTVPQGAVPANVPQDINTVPGLTLNGTQISSAVAIVQAVADGRLPREAGIGQLQTLVNLTAEQAEACMGSVGTTFKPTPKPSPFGQDGNEDPSGEDKPPKQGDKPEKDEEKKPVPPQFQRKVWTPTAPEAEELRVWYEVAQRKLKRAESLDFEYIPHHGGLPAEVTEQIKAKLLTATTAEGVREAFIVAETVTTAPEYNVETPSEIKALAESMNKMADALFLSKSAPAPVRADPSNINITMPAISLTAQMPEQGTVTVNVPQQPAPTVNVTMPEQAPPVVNVAAPKVVVMDGGPKEIDIERNRDGKITGAKVK